MDLTATTARLIRLASKIANNVEEIVFSDELAARVDRLPTNVGAYGVDAFGFDPEYLKSVMGIWAWFYRHYFRCQCFGMENVPDRRCILVSNHSGQLPFDAAMISMAVFLDREPPRGVRSMVERFVPDTPFVSTFMARCGQVLGTPENCQRLLDAEECILVFPEGVRGLNKTWRYRYQLQEFGQGFMRLALQCHTPVVPVAVVGAEEQAPAFWNAHFIGKLLGFPAFPVTPTNPWLPLVGLLPYPVRYRIHFGPPMTFEGDHNDEDEVIVRKVETVRARIQGMLEQGLAAREHVFW